MDARVECAFIMIILFSFLTVALCRPASQLGINLGEAHVIRNAGGLA